MTQHELESCILTHQAEVYRYLRYLGVSDPGSAEDLVQDTFLVAYRHPQPPPVLEDRRLAAWLRGIARNLYLNHCRKRKRNPVQLDPRLLEQAERYWEETFLSEGDGFEYLEALRGCLTQLAGQQRKLLELTYRENKSRAELAGIFEMSEDGIKSLLRRLRSVLGDCIRRRLRVGELG